MNKFEHPLAIFISRDLLKNEV